MRIGKLSASLAALALLGSCRTGTDEDTGQMVSACLPSSQPLAMPVAASGLDETAVLNWAQQSQGSRLMPKSWFDALERPGGGGKLADREFLGGMGLVTDEELTYPVGVALDCQDERELPNTGFSWYVGQEHRADSRNGRYPEAWVGLNCAACHSGVVRIEGEDVLVPGAPARFDYQSFVEAVDLALEETHPDVDAGRFDRFASDVFAASGQQYNAANRERLVAALETLLDWQRLTETRNFPQGEGRPRYGYARVDAFGHIYNKMTMFVGPADVDNPSTAPVSYPFLWGIQDQGMVQWNAGVANARLDNPVPVGNDELIDYGALGRNTGEVLGVFGDLRVAERRGRRPSYDSSVRVNNLMRLEELVGALTAPKLADHMSLAAGADLVESGRDLFGVHCASCHFGPGETNDRPDLPCAGGADGPTGGSECAITFEDMEATGNLTDIGMACNALLYSSPTVRMEGTRDKLVGGEELADVAPVGDLLEVGVQGVLADNIGDLAGEVLRNLWGVDSGFDDPALLETLPDVEQLCRSKISTPEGHRSLRYKARPLDGIWATGPYLHNGSVRTLRELLLPPAEREQTFWVGSTEFDAEEVGFVSEPSADGSTFAFDTSLPGNGNMGHVYGAADLSEADRDALIAYLKTL